MGMAQGIKRGADNKHVVPSDWYGLPLQLARDSARHRCASEVCVRDLAVDWTAPSSDERLLIFADTYVAFSFALGRHQTKRLIHCSFKSC